MEVNAEIEGGQINSKCQDCRVISLLVHLIWDNCAKHKIEPDNLIIFKFDLICVGQTIERKRAKLAKPIAELFFKNAIRSRQVSSK